MVYFTKFFSKIYNWFRLFGKYRHIFKIYQARKVLSRLLEIKKAHKTTYYPRVLSYIRKIDPMVFEELVLNSIENANLYVIRNKSYTGDGGVDGRFVFEGKMYLVQSKRYSGYIDNKDVQALARLVQLNKVAGAIFVHTGKTGEKARAVFNKNTGVFLVSGRQMVDFILGINNIRYILRSNLNT